MKKAVVLAVVLIGVVSFFLPLVRVQAPMVGTQRISGWDAVQRSQQKSQRDDLGLSQTLDQLRADILHQQRQQAPLAVRQAEALKVTLPVAYVCLLLAAALVFLPASWPLQLAAVLGLLSGVYSLISVFWLNSGVKAMLAGMGGRRGGFLGLFGRKVAQNVEVSPEFGLYLLLATLVVLLLASFLVPARR